MSVYRDGAPFPVTIFEAAALWFAVKVTCSRCPNSLVFEAGGLWWHFRKRYWDDHFANAQGRFYCNRCACGGALKVRPRRLEAVKEKPGRVLPPPDEREWKRAASRYRA